MIFRPARYDTAHWGPWFAWRPVRLQDRETVVWLEYVERRSASTVYWRPEYRLTEEKRAMLHLKEAGEE